MTSGLDENCEADEERYFYKHLNAKHTRSSFPPGQEAEGKIQFHGNNFLAKRNIRQRDVINTKQVTAINSDISLKCVTFNAKRREYFTTWHFGNRTSLSVVY